MPRKKSYQDIFNQAKRIEQELVNRGYGGASARFERVEDAAHRYMRNIGMKMGGEMGRRGYPSYDDNFDQYKNRKVSRNTYMGLNAG